jgi:ABC-type branched-subunit amino acid transport system ATPase component
LRPTFRARAGIGYVPQGRRIFPALTVRENLRMGAIGANQPDSIIDEVLVELPRLVPILDRAGGVLSGGEQQILALGRALCGRPKLLLLDEPTEGIQPSIRDEIVASLLALRPKRGLSLLVVEQNLDFIRGLSDRILIIQKGRIIDEIMPDRVMSPEVVAQLVGMSD